MAQNKQLVPLNQGKSKKEAIDSLRGILTKMMPGFEKILQNLPVDMMVQDIINAVAKNPLLQECTPISLMRCAMMTVQLGLRPETPQQLAHFVPFMNRKLNVREAQFMPGYRGLIKKALENPLLGTIEARCVFVGEPFELEFGINQKLVHKVDLTGEASELGDKLADNLEKFIGCYAIFRLRPDAHGVEPVPIIEWMSKKAILAIKNGKVKAKDGPWFDAYDFFQQCRKTVIKRGCNYVPSGPSDHLGLAVGWDNQAQSHEDQKVVIPEMDNINVEVFGEEEYEDEPETTKTNKVGDDLKKKAAETKKTTEKPTKPETQPKPTGGKPDPNPPESPADPPPPEPPAEEPQPEPPEPEPEETTPLHPDEPDEPEPEPAPEPEAPKEPTKPAARAKRTNKAIEPTKQALSDKLNKLIEDNAELLGPEAVAQFTPERIAKWGDKAVEDSITYFKELIETKQKGRSDAE